jgi:hypothetical protein
MSTTAVAAETRTELAASLSRLVDTARGYLAARLDAAITAVKEDVSDPDGMLPGAAVGVVEAECERLLPLGAERVQLLYDGTNSCIVMQDIEGNEFCLD